MLTAAQKQMIAKAKAAGFGYILFAASVERQGVVLREARADIAKNARRLRVS